MQEQHELGFNYRLTDIQAALGALAARASSSASSRAATRSPTATARRSPASTALELPPGAPAGSRHAYHLFVVRHRDGAAAPARALRRAARARHLAQVHYVPVYRHPWYAQTYGYARGPVPRGRALLRGLPVAAVLPRRSPTAEQDRVDRRACGRLA